MTAFTELLEAEIPKLRRYARALTRDAVRADDLVQNALVRAIAKQHLWQPGTDLRAWLFTILHHQNVNDVRRSLREGDRVPVEHVAPTLATVSDPTAALQIRDLERAIAVLPEEQRQVLLLVGLEGMRYEDVAVILDIPIGTVRSRLSRGRETLRRLMDIRGKADLNRGSPSCKAAYPIASEGAAVAAFSRLGRDLRREMRRKLPRNGRSGAPLSPVIGFVGHGGERLAKVTTARGVAGNAAGAHLPAADHRVGRGRIGGEDNNRILLGRQHLGHHTAEIAATDAMRAEQPPVAATADRRQRLPHGLDGAWARRLSARSSG
jgi:RNA polymerase sigma-70 factor, ECF subfamily